MTQEDKELLLKDLCARLPYGVKVEIVHWRNRDKGMIDSKIFRFPLNINKASVLLKPTSDIRPYLFPLSSMTEEQKEEYHYIVNYISPDDTENWAEGEFIYANQMEQLLHFYHINHLDYRGLIPMDLAIDATGKNIY